MDKDSIAILLLLTFLGICFGITKIILKKLTKDNLESNNDENNNEIKNYETKKFVGDLSVTKKNTGLPNSTGSAFCGKCGNSIYKYKNLPNVDSVDSVIFMTFVPGAEKIRCIECGTIVNPAYDRCFVCGKVISKRG